MKLSTKRNKFVSILAIVAILFTLSPMSAFAATPMSDIEGHWAKDQIQSWVDSEYIKGYPDGTFKPENNITRAEFMTIANNAFGFTEKADINFSDVEAGKWYTDAVAIAKEAGYINGYPDGTMKPNAPITRQEAAVMIGKITELEADETAADDFTDGKNIPAWSKGSVGACVTAKILIGYPNGSFLGENNIKRSESVAALTKALSYINAPDEIIAAIYAIDTEGFQLGFYPAVEGLTQGAVTLTEGDSNVTIETITTTDNGESYAVTAALEEGKTYGLTLTIDSYDFGEAFEFTVLSAQEAADVVNNLVAALPALDALTIDDADAVLEAAAAFDSLTEAQQTLVTEENMVKLNAAIDKIDSLIAAEETQPETNQ